jgi:hypothetical protein
VPPIVKTISASPSNGGSRVTSPPMQRNLTILGRTRAALQGSDPVPEPLYTQPVEPAGLPRPVHPDAWRFADIEGEPPMPLSTMLNVAPRTAGDRPGRSNGASGVVFATILATL